LKSIGVVVASALWDGMRLGGCLKDLKSRRYSCYQVQAVLFFLALGLRVMISELYDKEYRGSGCPVMSERESAIARQIRPCCNPNLTASEV
jgi:hypothetical protein